MTHKKNILFIIGIFGFSITNLFAQSAYLRCTRSYPGDLEQEISACTELINANTKDATLYEIRGNKFAKKADYNKALLDYSDAIIINPKNYATFSNRGRIWHQLGDFDRAVLDYTTALKLFNQDATVYIRRGNSFRELNDNEKAILDYSEAIKIDKSYGFAFESRGLVYFQMGRFDEAILDLQEAVKFSPKNANISEQLNFILEKRKQPEKHLQDDITFSNITNEQIRSRPKRVALIIGNGNYRQVDKLENPPRDAKLIADVFREVGFDEIILKIDLSREQILAILNDFSKISRSAEWATIYFAGHAFEIAGINYILPVDAKVVEEQMLSTEAINIQYLLKSVQSASKFRLLILDACRNNPYVDEVRLGLSRGTPGVESANISAVGKGLSRVEPEPGTLVVYSAKHGQLALDGDGNNSPFAEAFAKRAKETPPIEIRRLFEYVRKDVFAITGKMQQPFAYGSLEPSEDFYFGQK